jgi:hypothetical protein
LPFSLFPFFSPYYQEAMHYVLPWLEFRFANCSFKSLFTAHSSDWDWWFLKCHDIVCHTPSFAIH